LKEFWVSLKTCCLKTGTGLDREFTPYYSKFKGTIRKIDKQDYEVRGLFKLESDNTLVISELPVETWTMDFREKLDKMLADGVIRDFSDTSTDTDVLVKVKLGPAGLAPVEKLLVEKIKLTNMHAFNSKCVIHKYESVSEILREFCGVRLGMYRDRLAHMLKELRDRLPYHENVVRFIRQQCEDKPRPELRKKTGEECDRLLSLDNFAKIKYREDTSKYYSQRGWTNLRVRRVVGFGIRCNHRRFPSSSKPKCTSNCRE
jgi:hypothetical protein